MRAQPTSWRVVASLALLALVVPSTAAPQSTAVSRTRLPYGLTVVVRENHESPVVAYSLMARMGTSVEWIRASLAPERITWPSVPGAW